MSLFVNPAQFSEDGDLAAIRATTSATSRSREHAGVDLVFAPSVEEMYPPGFQTWVDVTELGSILEGRFRPGHFRGVATVVLKLFEIVRPDRAYFGQKDAQHPAPAVGATGRRQAGIPGQEFHPRRQRHPAPDPRPGARLRPDRRRVHGTFHHVEGNSKNTPPSRAIPTMTPAKASRPGRVAHRPRPLRPSRIGRRAGGHALRHGYDRRQFGQPGVQRPGELTGLNFDRVYEATINDFAWDESYSRSIGVDIRFILWFLDKYGGAGRLLTEMGVK